MSKRIFLGVFTKLLTVILSVFIMDSLCAEIYKWVDKEGKVIYGDKPESENVDEIKIRKVSEQDSATQERHKEQDKLLGIMQEERDEKNALKKKEKQKKQEQRRLCAKAGRKLQKIKDAALLYEKTDDPNNPRIFSDKERQVEEIKYEKFIGENC